MPTTALRLLLIDSTTSDPLVYPVTELALRSAACEVMQAHDVATGIHYALHDAPHIILLDMDIPGNECGKVCLQLRLNGYQGRVLLVAEAFDANVAYAIEQYEADGFIAKPISRSALLEQIEALGFVLPALIPAQTIAV